MQSDIIKIESISQFHQISGYGKPTHPLITIIDISEIETLESHIGIRSVFNLYVIGLKDSSCGNQYGRNHYDFDSGVLFFHAPNQIQTITRVQKKGEVKGWMIIFHPDLIRNTPLGKKIEEYNFFDYAIYEALHLSESEQKTITDCIKIIKDEITGRVDDHSQTVISSTLELLLNFSHRFYERQFNTRSAQNSDIIIQFESLLKSYCRNGYLEEYGIPKVDFFSKELNLSANYLSTLLKRETGENIKEHINIFVIEKAKGILLNTSKSINEIAYELGFNYPHYFSRLFKNKIGKTPNEYRKMK